MYLQVLYNSLFILGVALKNERWNRSKKTGFCHLVHLKPQKMFCPPEFLQFAFICLKKKEISKFFWSLRRLQFMFLLLCSESEFFSVNGGGTLKILPLSEDCVFDCINILCSYPVNPILWGFCWTQLKCLWIVHKTRICIICSNKKCLRSNRTNFAMICSHMS